MFRREKKRSSASTHQNRTESDHFGYYCFAVFLPIEQNTQVVVKKRTHNAFVGQKTRYSCRSINQNAFVRLQKFQTTLTRARQQQQKVQRYRAVQQQHRIMAHIPGTRYNNTIATIQIMDERKRQKLAISAGVLGNSNLR